MAGRKTAIQHDFRHRPLRGPGQYRRWPSLRCNVSNGSIGANSNALARCIRANLMSCSVAWKMNWRVYGPADPKVHYNIDVPELRASRTSKRYVRPHLVR